MPEVIETIVYTYEELSDAAQDAARDWYRELGPHYGWWQAVYEDFAMICDSIGINLKTRIRNASTQRQFCEPCVWFTGFRNQGDGASFEASWRYARGGSLAIRAHAPQDRVLHHIADRLQDVQRRNIYQLAANIDHRGQYCHEHAMVITVERDSAIGQPPTEDAETTVAGAMRDLARWLYKRLEAEHEHITSESEVEAAIIANEYTFTVSGCRFG